jgi:hypothetical protein
MCAHCKNFKQNRAGLVVHEKACVRFNLFSRNRKKSKRKIQKKKAKEVFEAAKNDSEQNQFHNCRFWDFYFFYLFNNIPGKGFIDENGAIDKEAHYNLILLLITRIIKVKSFIL